MKVPDLRKWFAHLPLIGGQAFDLAIAFASMVVVERVYGHVGLGIYSHLLSVFVILTMLSDLGVSNSVLRSGDRKDDAEENDSMILKDAVQTIVLLGTLTGLVFLFFRISYSDVMKDQYGMYVYFFILLAVPLHNLNNIAAFLLHARGEHGLAARGRAKRKMWFTALFLLAALLRLSVEKLFIAFLLSEVFVLRSTFNVLPFSLFRGVFSDISRVKQTVKQGLRVIFIDGMLKALLYIDFFVLGLFVSARELGVYSEASLLIRFFLIIPMSMRPLYVRKYCQQMEGTCTLTADEFLAVTGRYMFLNALFALFLIIYFPEMLNAVFNTHGEERAAFRLFAYMLPGLFYYASLIVSEPLYEGMKEDDTLRRVVWYVMAINLGLNLYLVPYAGIEGSAVATMLSMVAYSIFFVKGLPFERSRSFFPLALGGGAVYLEYILLKNLKTHLFLELVSIPLVLYVLFSIAGVYDRSEKKVRFTL